MRKASFKVVNANGNSSPHNSRQNPPKYLIETDPDFNENHYELIHNDEEFLQLAQMKYLQKNNQKMQERQKTALIKETVLNLEKHHTVDDIKNLFKKLNEKYGGHYITELSIHRDEGHLEKDGIAYYPTKHIIQKNEEWYIVPLKKFLDSDYKPKKEDFTEKVNINEFKKVHNIHAHVKFSMFDLGTGLTGRMTKGQVSQRLKVVAKELGLEYKPNEKISSGKAINTIKDEHDLQRRTAIKALFLGEKINKETNKRKELKTELAKIKDVKIQFKEEKQALIDSHAATQTDYTILRRKYKELEELARKKDLTIEKLKKELSEKKEELKKKEAELAEKPKEIEKIVRVPVEKIVEKDVYSPKYKNTKQQPAKNRNVVAHLEAQLEAQKQENTTLKQENSVLRETIAEVTRYLKCTKDQIVEKVKSMFQKEDIEEDKAWEEVLKKNLSNQDNPRWH